MAKIVIIGAGFAGNTAAVYLGNRLGKDHEITVVNKYDYFLYLPSLIWVGIGTMKPEKVQVPLEPVYDRINIRFIHGSATEIHPDENYIVADKADSSEKIRVDYDYLLISTGPTLNYKGTAGLGPQDGYTQSVCWLDHAIQTRDAYFECVKRMEKGETIKFVIGAGHAETTCQGAAFEYLSNLHWDLVNRRLRHKAELVWLSNEPKIGDFGVGGLHVRHKGSIMSSEQFIAKVFRDYGIQWEVQKAIKEIDGKYIFWENYEGDYGNLDYDFAMLIPQFLGPKLSYTGKNGNDISNKIVNKKGFILVDGYYGLEYKNLIYTPEAWPAVYQNPEYRNIFAAGIAFAVPGPISPPHTTLNGTLICATPPRTGMVSGIIGRLVALNIISLVKYKKMRHQERMTEMFAACIASMSGSLLKGCAATITVFPLVPNYKRYQNEHGRDLFVTHMEMGLAGAWLKRIIHTTMLYKAKANLGWQFIPE